MSYWVNSVATEEVTQEQEQTVYQEPEYVSSPIYSPFAKSTSGSTGFVTMDSYSDKKQITGGQLMAIRGSMSMVNFSSWKSTNHPSYYQPGVNSEFITSPDTIGSDWVYLSASYMAAGLVYSNYDRGEIYQSAEWDKAFKYAYKEMFPTEGSVDWVRESDGTQPMKNNGRYLDQSSAGASLGSPFSNAVTRYWNWHVQKNGVPPLIGNVVGTNSTSVYPAIQNPYSDTPIIRVRLICPLTTNSNRGTSFSVPNSAYMPIIQYSNVERVYCEYNRTTDEPAGSNGALHWIRLAEVTGATTLVYVAFLWGW